MDIDWSLISNFTVAMFAVVNPVEKIPLWVQASQGGKGRFQWLLAGSIMLSCAGISLF